MPEETAKRTTIADLKLAFYSHLDHHLVADRGMRRYHPYSLDFDSTAMLLEEPDEHWEEQVRELHLKNRGQVLSDLKERYGVRRHDLIVQNMRDLGSKPFSLVAYHNRFYHEAREAFIVGSYYPALVAACALGERILNHLILDLRDDFASSPHHKRVRGKESFDNWGQVVRILTDWNVLVDGVDGHFLELGKLRHRSVHFNPETYLGVRDDALAALKLIGNIVSKQFGFFGYQPWFIEGTAGAQFIKKSYETNPFVRKYLIPASGFVGVMYGMEGGPDGHWHHLDIGDYGDGSMDDTEFAKAFAARDPKKVITRELIDAEQSEGAAPPE